MKDTADYRNKKPWYKNKDNDKKEIVCYKCKKKGHIAKNCRVQTHRANQVIRKNSAIIELAPLGKSNKSTSEIAECFLFCKNFK